MRKIEPLSLVDYRLTALARFGALVPSRAIRRRYGFYPIAGAEDPPADPPADPPTDPPATPPDDPAKAWDYERGMAAIKAARDAENKAKRDAAAKETALQKKIDEYESAKLTDQQKIEKERDEAKAALAKVQEDNRRIALQAAVERTATKLEFADVDDAYGHIVLHPDKVEYNDDGSPKNIESVLKALLEAKPHLKAGAAGGGVPSTPRPQDAQSREQQVQSVGQKLAASGRYPKL